MSERIISIKVRDRIAVTESDEPYICGNTDYVVQFDFDEEWDAYDVKTARFTHDGVFHDVVFSGNSCPVPAIRNAYEFYVGVYAGDLWVTTAARVPSKKSVLCENAAPEKPPESVYNKIMAMLNEQSKNSVKTWSDLGETTVIAPISWDGDTEGRESVIHEHVTSNGEITTNTYYKVSDTPLTKEELTGCDVGIILLDYDTGFRDTITEDQIETIDLDGSEALLGSLGVLSVPKGHPTVSAGLYFASMSFVGAKVRMVLYKVQINKIPDEYMDVAEVAKSGSYNDLIDKPTIPAAVTDDHINSLIDEKMADAPPSSYSTGDVDLLITMTYSSGKLTATFSKTYNQIVEECDGDLWRLRARAYYSGAYMRPICVSEASARIWLYFSSFSTLSQNGKSYQRMSLYPVMLYGDDTTFTVEYKYITSSTEN